MRLKSTFLTAAGTLLAAVAMAQSTTYKVIDLGPVGLNGQPFAVTDYGLVASGVQNGNTIKATLWYKGKTWDIGTPGLKGQNSQAEGVNKWGEVVGEAQTTTPDPNNEDFCGFAALGLESSGTTCAPFLWQNGIMRALPTVEGGHNGWALKVNIRGEVAGTAENGTPDSTCPSGSPQKLRFKPTVWRNGYAQELPTYSGDPDGSATAINDLGHVTGASGECAAFNVIFQSYLQPLHALLWKDGKASDLGTLGGDGHGTGIEALDLNNHGHVVGFSDLQGDANFHGFLWTPETGMQDLGTVPGDANSLAIGINDAGQVVGVSVNSDFTQFRAFVRRDGKLVDLNTLIPANSPLYLGTACKITAAGAIIGIAIDQSGNFHGYMAVPQK